MLFIILLCYTKSARINFYFPVQIICGKEESFEKVGDFFETWYQRMITQLTFTQPTIGSTSLGDEAEHFRNSFEGLDELTSLDSTLLAVLRRDTRKVRSVIVISL